MSPAKNLLSKKVEDTGSGIFLGDRFWGDGNSPSPSQLLLGVLPHLGKYGPVRGAAEIHLTTCFSFLQSSQFQYLWHSPKQAQLPTAAAQFHRSSTQAARAGPSHVYILVIGRFVSR
jgi:hypothetical protein